MTPNQTEGHRSLSIEVRNLWVTEAIFPWETGRPPSPTEPHKKCNTLTYLCTLLVSRPETSRKKYCLSKTAYIWKLTTMR